MHYILAQRVAITMSAYFRRYSLGDRDIAFALIDDDDAACVLVASRKLLRFYCDDTRRRRRHLMLFTMNGRSDAMVMPRMLVTRCRRLYAITLIASRSPAAILLFSGAISSSLMAAAIRPSQHEDAATGQFISPLHFSSCSPGLLRRLMRVDAINIQAPYLFETNFTPRPAAFRYFLPPSLPLRARCTTGRFQPPTRCRTRRSPLAALRLLSYYYARSA